MGAPAELVRRREGAQQPLGDLDDLRALRDALQQHGELVAAQARGGVHAAQGRAQAVGDADEQLVARGVAQRVVDGLEVVEVDERDGDDLVVPRRPLQRLLDAVEEQRAVGEAGERVVQRAVAQLGLQLALLGRVADAQHEAAHRAVGTQVGDADHHGQPEAGRVAHAQRHLARRLWRGERVERLRVLRMGELGQPPAPQALGPAPEHVAHGAGEAVQPPVAVEDGDRVARVLDERAQQRGAAAAPMPERDEGGDDARRHDRDGEELGKRGRGDRHPAGHRARRRSAGDFVA